MSDLPPEFRDAKESTVAFAIVFVLLALMLAGLGGLALYSAWIHMNAVQ